MASGPLTARSPLDGVRRERGGTVIEDVTDLALVSAAVPLGGDAAFAEAIKKVWKADRPATGDSTVSADRTVRIMGMQPDQLFLLFPAAGDAAAGDAAAGDAAAGDAAPAAQAAAALGQSAYITDQSDAWAMLRIAGPKTREALARLCMLDLGMLAPGMLDRGMLDPGMLDRGMPDRGMPDRGMPDRGMPDRGMPDRDDAAFPVGRVARTVMEHLAVIVLRDSADSFLLLTPRSSARAFLDALETSFRNVG